MSKHKSNNQLVKEIASTAIPINSGNGIDLEFLPSFLQSNIIQKTFNISDRWSQTIRSILSLDQTSVAQYGNFYIETFAEPASVGYRSFPPLGKLPLDILYIVLLVYSNTLIEATSKWQIFIQIFINKT